MSDLIAKLDRRLTGDNPVIEPITDSMAIALIRWIADGIGEMPFEGRRGEILRYIEDRLRQSEATHTSEFQLLCKDDSGENITQEYLKKIFHYDPETGIFRRRVTRGRSKAGKIAGFGHEGYLKVGIHGKYFHLHRLAFLYMTGAFPAESVDHINGDPSDNRWSNLRPVSHAENMRNTKIRSDNRSGVAGVDWNLRQEKWRARIIVHRKEVSLGSFDTKEEAVLARIEAERRYGFHPNHGRNP